MNSVLVSEIEKRELSLKKSLSRVLSLEYLCNNINVLAKFYTTVFYKKMILNEMDLAGIDETKRVAHIGSGPFPMTALYLAEKKITTHCYDIDCYAIEASKKMIEKSGKNKYIRVFNSSEHPVNYSKYDIIILSLHVIKKREIIKEIMGLMVGGKTIVYRNPRGYLTRYFNVFEPEHSSLVTIKRVKQPLFKESVALTINV